MTCEVNESPTFMSGIALAGRGAGARSRRISSSTMIRSGFGSS
jgi:hypothetical protein